MGEPQILVHNLSKTYRVPVREEGLKAAAVRTLLAFFLLASLLVIGASMLFQPGLRRYGSASS